jgi:hypothetical protein
VDTGEMMCIVCSHCTHEVWISIQPAPSDELRNGIKIAVSQSFKMLETLWKPNKVSRLCSG